MSEDFSPGRHKRKEGWEEGSDSDTDGEREKESKEAE